MGMDGVGHDSSSRRWWPVIGMIRLSKRNKQRPRKPSADKKSVGKKVPSHLKEGARKCLFCGEPGLSATHVWPNWLNRLFPAPTRTQGLRFTDHLSPTTKKYRQTYAVKQGNLFSQKPKLACVDCNTTWMERFEQDVLVFLKAALIANAPPVINRKQMTTLAGWLGLITILAEYVSGGEVTISALDRAHLKRNRLPPSNWRIYIGAHGSQDWMRGYAHYPWSNQGTLPVHEQMATSAFMFPCDCQVSMFGIGRLVVRVWSASVEDHRPDFERDCRAFGMQRLWPLPTRFGMFPLKSLSLPPGRELSEEQINSLADGFNLRLEYRTALERKTE